MFSRTLNLRILNHKLLFFIILKDCKVSFSLMINSYTEIFDLNRKTKQRKFRKKNRRFRNRENMWWAWPVARNLAGNSWLTSRSWGMTFNSVPGKKSHWTLMRSFQIKFQIWSFMWWYFVGFSKYATSW